MNQRTLRKTRELEGRRQDILASAESLFSKHGYFKTSMTDIAEAAEAAYGLHGMLNSTIYLWILNAKPTTSLVAKSESLASLFFQGVVPPAGKRRNSS